MVFASFLQAELEAGFFFYLPVKSIEDIVYSLVTTKTKTNVNVN